jgi:NTP pyrophosphatase (non-canonical NTP hydrolase)
MIDLRQKELHAWQERNFGNHEDDILKCALGVAEESGEVCHHVLKGTQRIRGGINGINRAEVADGVADVLIYGIQLLTLLDLDAEVEISKVIDKVLKRDWATNAAGENSPVKLDNQYDDNP